MNDEIDLQWRFASKSLVLSRPASTHSELMTNESCRSTVGREHKLSRPYRSPVLWATAPGGSVIVNAGANQLHRFWRHIHHPRSCPHIQVFEIGNRQKQSRNSEDPEYSSCGLGRHRKTTRGANSAVATCVSRSSLPWS